MKKNLVIIMADQLRYDVLSPELTPNIWSIREEGIAFVNAYTACPLCVPARGAFFTGTYPNRNGSLINPWVEEDKEHGLVKEGFDNLYTMMCKDYQVIHSGKQHLYTEGDKLEHRPYFGVDFVTTEESYAEFLAKNGKKRPGGLKFKSIVPEMVSGRNTRAARYSNPNTGIYEPGEDYYFDGYFTNETIKALKARDREKPLFLSAMFVAPHPPLEIPEKWYRHVRNEDFELPENVAQFYKYQSPLQLYNLTGAIGTHYTKSEWKESWRTYLGLVAYLDHLVGRIIAELKEQGIYEDTAIIFTADHGEMLGSHSLYQKMCMYEESSHVPLFMRFPDGFITGKQKEYESYVSLIDVIPTLSELFGLEHTNGFDGVSLVDLIEKGDDAVPARPVFMQYDGNGARSNFQRSVIIDGYKLIVDLFQDEYYLELYNLEEDREEKENLIFSSEEHDSFVCSMIERLRRHMEETGDLIELPEIDISSFRREHATIGAKQFN